MLRLARIYPVHFTILMLLLVGVLAQSMLSSAGLGIESQERFAPEGLVKHLLLIAWSSATWNPPAWSLSAEWVAYLTFPVVAFLAARPSLPAALAALGMLGAGFAAAYDLVFDHDLDQHGLLRVAFEFPAGCLLYRVAQSVAPWLAGLVLATAASAAVALFGTPWGDFAVVPVLAAMILVCASVNPLSKLFAASWLVWLGEISYSLYMVHLLVLGMLSRAAARLLAAVPDVGHVLGVALALAAAVAVAATLHYVVERPAREFFRRWIKGAVPAAPAVLPVQMRPS
jgi:peptidoglycan/LPS O-acetylase OafA/YrhL